MVNESISELGNDKNFHPILDFLSQKFSAGKEFEVIKEDESFQKFYFKHKSGQKCPFSLWIDKSGKKVFFNIGLFEKNVTILQYTDITFKDGIDEVLEFLNAFLSSKVLETSIFCKNKLVRINYKIVGKTYYSPTYSYVHKSSLFCFKKRKQKKIYSEWIT